MRKRRGGRYPGPARSVKHSFRRARTRRREPRPGAPCGLPLALGCRRLWRLGYRRDAWTAGVLLGVFTAAATLVAGLLGLIAVAVYAASWWLARRG